MVIWSTKKQKWWVFLKKIMIQLLYIQKNLQKNRQKRLKFTCWWAGKEHSTVASEKLQSKVSNTTRLFKERSKSKASRGVTLKSIIIKWFQRLVFLREEGSEEQVPRCFSKSQCQKKISQNFIETSWMFYAGVDRLFFDYFTHCFQYPSH